MFETINTDDFVGGVASEIGGRAENQDSYGFRKYSSYLALTVCDGMGGGPAGKMASSMAVETILDYIALAQGSLEEIAENAITKANEIVFKKACSDDTLHGMGSTCTLLLLGKSYAVAAHVGDSRIYQLRKGKIKYRSFDHSMVFDLVKKKVITEEQARQSAQSNVITRALGINKEVEPEIHILNYRKGDIFVMTTDGIHGTMPQVNLLQEFNSNNDDIAANVKSVAEKVDNIGKEKGNNYDNLTIMMVKTTGDIKEKGLKGMLDRLWSRLFATTALLTLSFSAVAQIPYWKQALSNADLEYSYGTIYKKKDFGRMQLIDIKENKNVASSQDSITNFSGGFALGLKNESGKMRIVSIINGSAYTEIMPRKALYSTDLPFFSEGMVTVANNKGVEGYMNVNGDLVIKCAYFKAMPFSDGRAMVVLKNKLARKYIDNRGKFITFAERDEEKVKSEVCQWDAIEPDKGWTIYKEGKLYGFEYDGKIAIPAQFDYAENFHAGYALVKKDGQCGIMGYSDDNVKVAIDADDDKAKCVVDYSEHVDPKLFQVLAINDKNETTTLATADDASKRQITCQLPEISASESLKIKVAYDGIIIKTLTYKNTRNESATETKAKSGSIYVASFGKKSKRADAHDNEYIVATIVNNTAKAQTVKATIYVDGTPHVQSVKVKAKRRATVTAKVQVKKERFAKVYVKLSTGYSTAAKDIQLKPFY